MKSKRIMALLLTSALSVSVSGIGGMSAFAMDANKYTDVPAEETLFGYVEDVVDSGIMEGDTDTEFGVETKVTRGDIVSYLYKMLMSPTESGSLRFEDVLDTEYEDAVMWADSVGLFEGLKEDFFEDGAFGADKEITRQELAVMLYNLAKGELKIDVAKNVPETFEEYSDGEDVAEEYSEAVRWAVGNAVIPLNEDAKLAPEDIANKAEVAEALSVLMGLITDETVEVAGEGREADTTVPTIKETEDTADDTKAEVPETKAPASGNTGNNSNQNTAPAPEKPAPEKPAPEKPAPEKPAHVHNWVTNYDTVEVAEQGHTEQQLVKEAWTETINHPAETHEEEQWVVDKEAWTETVSHPAETHEEEQWVVDKEAWTETINHPAETHEEEQWVVDKEAVYDTIHHPAETHEEEQWVVDKEAVYETIHHDAVYEDQWVVDKEAWDEEVWEQQIHWICFVCRLDMTEAGFDQTAVDQHMKQHLLNGDGDGYGTEPVDVLVDVIHHPEEGHYEKVLVKEAWDEEVLVSPEEGHYETVTIIDKEAWDEEVLVSPEEGHYETVTIIDKEAWTETIEHAEEGHYETVTIIDKEAWTETIEHAEEGHYETITVVDKEAWTETVEHPAEYKDVWVVDVPAYTTQVPNGYYCTGCGAFSGGGRG